MKVAKLKNRIKNIFHTRNIFAISLFAVLSRSLSFTWIFWDGYLSHKLYKHQKAFPDQILRFARLGIGISWFMGWINPTTAGVFLICDGAISILRYRSLNMTKSFIEDVPRLIRIGLGIMLLPLVI